MEFRERIEVRLAQLKEEYAHGQEKLSELEAQVGSVRAVMLRLSGAIQVLEEELASGGETGSANGASSLAEASRLSAGEVGDGHGGRTG